MSRIEFIKITRIYKNHQPCLELEFLLGLIKVESLSAYTRLVEEHHCLAAKRNHTTCRGNIHVVHEHDSRERQQIEGVKAWTTHLGAES